MDITATDVSKECLLDVLPRIPAIRWLAAGQLDGFTDQVMKVGQKQFINDILFAEEFQNSKIAVENQIIFKLDPFKQDSRLHT